MPSPRLIAFALASLAAGCSQSEESHPPSSGGLSRRWFTSLADSDEWRGVPAVSAGVLIVGARGGMAGFDAGTGALRWRAQIFSPTAVPDGTNIVVRGAIACIADAPGVGCADVASGRVVWRTPSDSATGSLAASAADDSTLYYGTRQHRLVALSLATGAPRWVADLAPAAPFSTRVFGAVVRNDTVYATTVRWLAPSPVSVAGDLVAIDARSGRILWSYTPPAGELSGFQSPPVLVGNLAIVSDVYLHVIRAIDLTTHTQVWQSVKDASGYIDSETAPAVVGDTVFAASTDTQIYALDLRTGARLWRTAPSGGSMGSIGLCGDRLITIPLSGGDPITVDRATHAVNRARLLMDGDLLQSVPAGVGAAAYVKGDLGVYAFACH